MLRMSLLIFSVATIGVLGCSSDATRTVSSVEVGLVERVVLGTASNAEEREVALQASREKNALIDTCMKDTGFQWYVPDPSTGLGLYSGPDRSLREFAEKFGFGVSTTFPTDLSGVRDPATKKNADYQASLSRSAQAKYSAAFGTCEADAAQDTSGGVALATKLINDRFERIQTTDEFRNEVAAWRSCANRVGVEASSLNDLIASFVPRITAGVENPEIVQADERRVASLTFQCNQDYRRSIAKLLEGAH